MHLPQNGTIGFDNHRHLRIAVPFCAASRREALVGREGRCHADEDQLRELGVRGGERKAGHDGTTARQNESAGTIHPRSFSADLVSVCQGARRVCLGACTSRISSSCTVTSNTWTHATVRQHRNATPQGDFSLQWQNSPAKKLRDQGWRRIPPAWQVPSLAVKKLRCRRIPWPPFWVYASAGARR